MEDKSSICGVTGGVIGGGVEGVAKGVAMGVEEATEAAIEATGAVTATAATAAVEAEACARTGEYLPSLAIPGGVVVPTGEADCAIGWLGGVDTAGALAIGAGGVGVIWGVGGFVAGLICGEGVGLDRSTEGLVGGVLDGARAGATGIGLMAEGVSSIATGAAGVAGAFVPRDIVGFADVGLANRTMFCSTTTSVGAGRVLGPLFANFLGGRRSRHQGGLC